MITCDLGKWGLKGRGSVGLDEREISAEYDCIADEIMAGGRVVLD